MKLHMTVGLPQSGKSTWARSKGFPIVNRDSIRKAIGGSIRYFGDEHKVTEIENIMVLALLFAGHQDVIVDATHLKKKYRDGWKNLALDHGFETDYEFFLTPMNICIERAKINYPKEYRFPGIIKSMWEMHLGDRGFKQEFNFFIPKDDNIINVSEGG